MLFALNILMKFDINFLENVWELNRVVTKKNEQAWDLLISIPKVIVLRENF